MKRRKPRGGASPLLQTKQGFAARGLSCSLGFLSAT
nr:MAG TPA: hypothetical protein [Caudoviricetes sp.]